MSGKDPGPEILLVALVKGYPKEEVQEMGFVGVDGRTAPFTEREDLGRIVAGVLGGMLLGLEASPLPSEAWASLPNETRELCCQLGEEVARVVSSPKEGKG